MSNEQPVYTVETSHGKKSFTTNALHTQFKNLEEFLKAHQQTISTIGIGVQIYSVYITHRGKTNRLG